MTTTPKVGSTVWIYDVNRRHYTVPTPEEKARGILWGQLIWRECWRSEKIVGETRVSWILEGGVRRLPKKRDFIHAETVCYSEAELDERCFAHEHAYNISQAVSSLGDAAKLRQIAKIAGYTAL